MTLVEGRNRQIRKMMQALGFTVVKLHRVEFMGICLGEQDSSSDASKGLKRPGDWAYLDASEMNLVKKALLRSSLSQESMQDASLDEEEEQ
jgi:16S rRNA U516 pseudouridylate synthase RsuA-like enzyme